MKKIFSVLLFFCLITNYSFTQYNVTYSTNTYESLTSADTVDESNVFQFLGMDVYQPIPIGFSFELNGEVFDSVGLAKNAFAVFRDIDPKYFISIFDCQLKDFNDDPINSPILYLTEGLPGNRIFKCEYKSTGFVNDPQNDDYVSVQLWLYENCNEFEVRIGQYQINSNVFYSNNPAPYIGWVDIINTSNELLTGQPTSPIITATSATLNSIPPTNGVYKFTNCNVGITELFEFNSIYPNPFENKLTLELKTDYTNLNIQILDITGKEVYKKVYTGSANFIELNVNSLEKGSYSLVVESQGIISNYSIIKN